MDGNRCENRSDYDLEHQSQKKLLKKLEIIESDFFVLQAMKRKNIDQGHTLNNKQI